MSVAGKLSRNIFSIQEGKKVFCACGWNCKIHIHLIYGILQGGREPCWDAELFDTGGRWGQWSIPNADGGKYVKWVSLEMHGICLPVCSFATGHRDRRVRFSRQITPWNKMVFSKKFFVSSSDVNAVFQPCFPNNRVRFLTQYDDT